MDGGLTHFGEVASYVYRVFEWRNELLVHRRLDNCRPHHRGGLLLGAIAGCTGAPKKNSSRRFAVPKGPPPHAAMPCCVPWNGTQNTRCRNGRVESHRSQFAIGGCGTMHGFPRLKFCGFTRSEDVLAALDAGAEAIGLNFYSASKRFVSLAVAESLSKVAHGHALRVGVFVNATPEEVESVVLRCGLDAIQLHGDEPVSWLERAHRLAGLQKIPVLRALPYRGVIDDAAVREWSKSGAGEGSQVMGLLIDAYDPIERGGTGKTAQWDLLYPRPNSFYGEGQPSTDRSGCRVPIGLEIDATTEPQQRPIPILLAGGIRPDNLQRALQTAQPDGIDMASGIETAPGIKDHQAMMYIGQMVEQHFGRR